jgi:menaquinone-dependent protoporphyrinogen IX oxidase
MHILLAVASKHESTHEIANVLADELRDYAGEITVIEPSALEQAIRLGFEKVVAAHV